MNQSLSYKDAGVDIDAGDALVEAIKPFAKRTLRPEVLTGIGLVVVSALEPDLSPSAAQLGAAGLMLACGLLSLYGLGVLMLIQRRAAERGDVGQRPVREPRDAQVGGHRPRRDAHGMDERDRPAPQADRARELESRQQPRGRARAADRDDDPGRRRRVCWTEGRIRMLVPPPVDTGRVREQLLGWYRDEARSDFARRLEVISAAAEWTGGKPPAMRPTGPVTSHGMSASATKTPARSDTMASSS